MKNSDIKIEPLTYITGLVVSIFIISFGIATLTKPEVTKEPADIMELKAEITELKEFQKTLYSLNNTYEKKLGACQYDLSKLQGGK